MPRRIKLVFAIVVLIFVTVVVLILVTCNLLLSPPAPPPSWETYTDRDLGFSFNYPKSFDVSQFNNSSSVSDPYCKTIRLEGPSGEGIDLMMNSRALVGYTYLYNRRSDELKINGIAIEKSVMYENNQPSSPGLVIYRHTFTGGEFLWVGTIPAGDTKAEPLYENIIGTLFAPLRFPSFYEFFFGPSVDPAGFHTC